MTNAKWCPDSEIISDYEELEVSSLQIASGKVIDKDIRPRLNDGKNSYLLDSGSMTSVWPAAPGDKVDQSILLQAVDGKHFACYGKKVLQVKINRKSYEIEAVIAKVKSPLLGWDFFDKYKLDMVWGNSATCTLGTKRLKLKNDSII